ncbi:MAG: hypothetical protein RR788_04285 [Erysipelotrichaceae bacterium]
MIITIQSNNNKYFVTAICKCLNILWSNYYAYQEQHEIPVHLNEIVVKIFNANQKVYGTRKIKVELMKPALKRILISVFFFIFISSNTHIGSMYIHLIILLLLIHLFVLKRTLLLYVI